MPNRPQENPRPGAPFVRGDGTRILNDGSQITMTMPDGTQHIWDRSGPRGSAGRYLGQGGQPAQQEAPQQAEPQYGQPPPPTASERFLASMPRFGTENAYLENGPKLPPPDWQNTNNPLLQTIYGR